jgi:hypothetical protein
LSIWAEARFNSFSALESSERQKGTEEIGGLAIPFQLESNDGKSLLLCPSKIFRQVKKYFLVMENSAQFNNIF